MNKFLTKFMNTEIVLGGLLCTRQYAVDTYKAQGQSSKFIDFVVFHCGREATEENKAQCINQTANVFPEGVEL